MMQIVSNISYQSSSTVTVKSVIERCLPIFATFWFFVTLDSYLIWNSFSALFHLISAILVVWGTFVISDKLSSSSYNRILFLCILVYYIWLCMTKSSSLATAVKSSTDFIPFLCIVLWPNEHIINTYRIIRKVFVFFSIGAAIVSVFILLGLNDHIPHLVLPAREPLHIRKGITYHLYVFFIAMCDPVTGVSGRACGMMQEPGHFAILLGLIYLIERSRGQKLNYWIVICGLLTFSSTFVLIVIFTEIHNLSSLKGLRLFGKYALILLLLLIVVFSFLPVEMRDQIIHYAYGRNLESVVDAYDETSSLTGALDERASSYMIANYEKMTLVQYCFGGGEIVSGGYCLSDYRGMIMYIGIFGLALAIILCLSLLVKTPFKLKIAIGLSAFLVVLHRSWMLFLPYIFFLAFVAVIAYRTNNEIGDNSSLAKYC